MRQDVHGLGELERAVLEHLWSAGSGDAKDVHAAIGVRRGITLNTIQSTLKRLFEKSLLERSKVSHAHVYAPAMTREAFERLALDHTIEKVLRNRPDAMLAAFVDLAERAGDEHLAKLEALIASKRRARGRK